MSTSLLPRRCLSWLRTPKIGRHRPLIVYHGQIQWFSSTRIRADTESVDFKLSFAGSSASTGSPFYQCSILSGSLSLFTADRFVLPHLAQHTGQNIPLLVLFVTPSLSSLLKEESAFFQHILGRIFSRLEIGREIDLLAAVVDSIPHVPEQYLKAVEADIPSNHGLGSDGISLLLSESCRTAPDLWSPRQESRERESMDIQQRSTVSFKHEPPEIWRKWAAERFPPLIYAVHSLELPLANTMFHNAQTSTMFAQRWTVTHNGETPFFECIKQTPLTQQTLNLTNSIGDGVLSVTLPLQPITVPRRVTAAMGNIIRRIQIGEIPEDHAPASEELEKDIHNYFERLGADETRVGVWALVTPQEVWASQPRSSRGRTLFSYIENGARLHKVLSGGGGWGVKQGLLSLDPHSTYSRSGQSSQLMIGDDEDLEAEKQTVLGQLVKPGDVVQFFIHRPTPIRTEVPQEPSRTQIIFNPVHGFRTTIFGTIPSTMDAMPAPSTTRSPHTLIHTHFGALSEQGISLKVTTHNARSPDSPTPVGAMPVGTVVQTKLDVPYARIGWIPTPEMFHKKLGRNLESRKNQWGRIRRITLYENEADTPSGTRVHRKMVPILPEAGGSGEEGRAFEALDKRASRVGALDDSPLGRDSQSLFDSGARGSSKRDRKDEEADGEAVFGEWHKGFGRPKDEPEPENQQSEGTRDGRVAAPGPVPASSAESRPPFPAPASAPNSDEVLGLPAPGPVYRKGVLTVTAGTRDSDGRRFRILRHQSLGKVIKRVWTDADGSWDRGLQVTGEGDANAERGVQARLVGSQRRVPKRERRWWAEEAKRWGGGRRGGRDGRARGGAEGREEDGTEDRGWGVGDVEWEGGQEGDVEGERAGERRPWERGERGWGGEERGWGKEERDGSVQPGVEGEFTEGDERGARTEAREEEGWGTEDGGWGVRNDEWEGEGEGNGEGEKVGERRSWERGEHGWGVGERGWGKEERGWSGEEREKRVQPGVEAESTEGDERGGRMNPGVEAESTAGGEPGERIRLRGGEFADGGGRWEGEGEGDETRRVEDVQERVDSAVGGDEIRGVGVESRGGRGLHGV